MSSQKLNDYIRANYQTMTDAEIGADMGVPAENVRSRRRTMGLKKTAAGGDISTATKIAEILEKSGIDVEDIGKIDKVRLNNYQSITKDDLGTAHVHDLEASSILLTPKWAEGPEWPVVQPAAPVVIKPYKGKKVSKSWGKTCVILPDPQIGYRKYDDGTMDPFHDEKAMSVALQIVKELQPDIIINIGDMLDLAEYSRFVGEASFARTTQASIDRAHEFLAQQKAASPSAKIVLFEGNHDRRIDTWIKKNAMQSFGLRPGGTPPETWPSMSIPALLNLDALGVKYIEGYPAGSYYINDRLKVKHGDKTGKRGTVANKIVSDEQVSTITGHTHGLEMVYHTVDTQRGPRTRFGSTLGCLCRIDGAVPSTKGSTDSFGRPVKRYEDWQQGIGVVTYLDGDNPFDLEKVYIHEGFSIFRGKPFFAEQL